MTRQEIEAKVERLCKAIAENNSQLFTHVKAEYFAEPDLWRFWAKTMDRVSVHADMTYEMIEGGYEKDLVAHIAIELIRRVPNT